MTIRFPALGTEPAKAGSAELYFSAPLVSDDERGALFFSLTRIKERRRRIG